MTRPFPLIALLLALPLPLGAQAAPAPEECLATNGIAGAITVTHAGKSYRLTSEACRAQFLTDPERYAQLYDALTELHVAGTPLVPTPASASLVPS